MYISSLQKSVVVAIILAALSCVVAIGVEAWKFAALAWLFVTVAVGALVTLNLRSTRRQSARIRQYGRVLSGIAADMSSLAASVDNQGSSTAATVNTPDSAIVNAPEFSRRDSLALQEEIKSEVEMSRRRVAEVHERLERGFGELGTLVETMNSRIAAQSDLLSSALPQMHERLGSVLEGQQATRSKISYRLRRYLEPLAEDVASAADRLEFAERRILSTLDASIRQSQDQSLDVARDLSGALSGIEQSVQDAVASRIEDLARTYRQGLESIETQLEALNSLGVGSGKDDNSLVEATRRIVEQAIPRIVYRVSLAAQNETQQVEALLQSGDLWRRARAPMPPTGRWAMNAQELVRLGHLLREVEPRTIVELGGGTSSVWIGYEAESWGGRVVSIDHDEHYATKTQRSIRQHKLEDTVEVRLAPLKAVEIGSEKFDWYDATALDDIESIDLLLVDGPPSPAGLKSRLPAVPLLARKLSRDAWIVLDDVDRTDEQEILESWLAVLPDFEIIDLGVDQLGVLGRRKG